MSSKRQPVTNQQFDQIEILDPVLRQGFAQLPRAILKAPNLSRNAKCLYALLLDYAWQEGSCFPGQARLAEDLGVTDRTIRTDLQELREFSLIDWKQRGMNKTNVYYILSLATNANLKLQEINSELDRKDSSTPERKDSSVHERKDSSDLLDSELLDSEDLYTDISFRKGNDAYFASVTQLKTKGEPHSNGVTRLSDALASYSKPARGRPPKATEAISTYMTQFSHEMHDSEHIKSNITHAMRLFRQSGLSESDFMARLFEARAITKDRSGSIRKETGEWGVKNRAPYFFSVLEDVLGMKEEVDDQKQLTLDSAAAPEVEEAPVDDTAILWQKVLVELVTQMSKPNYSTWMRETELISLDEDKATITAPSQYQAEMLEQRIKPLIEKTLRGITGKKVITQFTLAG